MSEAQPTIAEEVERYLRTGETDPHHAAWPGKGFMERANRADEDLRGALLREVRRLAEGLAHEPLPQADTVALTRDKVEPMVRGLFPRIAGSPRNRINLSAGATLAAIEAGKTWRELETTP